MTCDRAVGLTSSHRCAAVLPGSRALSSACVASGCSVSTGSFIACAAAASVTWLPECVVLAPWLAPAAQKKVRICIQILKSMGHSFLFSLALILVCGGICGGGGGRATSALASPFEVQEVWPLAAATFYSGVVEYAQGTRTTCSKVEPCRPYTVPDTMYACKPSVPDYRVLCMYSTCWASCGSKQRRFLAGTDEVSAAGRSCDCG